jgi:hypothetical protein
VNRFTCLEARIWARLPIFAGAFIADLLQTDVDYLTSLSVISPEQRIVVLGLTFLAPMLAAYASAVLPDYAGDNFARRKAEDVSEADLDSARSGYSRSLNIILVAGAFCAPSVLQHLFV